MKNQFRLIHFIPDHFTGERFAVGALVREEGEVQVAIAERIPGAECLGSDETYMLLRHMLAELRQLRSFDQLPMSVGPHFVLAKPKEVHGIEGGLVHWVTEKLLPRPLEKKSTVRKRGPNRSSMGRDYLRQFHVEQYVTDFSAPRDLVELNGAAETFPSISHAVRGSRELILMEPISLLRKNVQRDLTLIGRDFWACRGIFNSHQMSRNIDLYAYLLPGGPKEERAHVSDMLREAAHNVFDMNHTDQRQEFVQRVEEVGSSQSGANTTIEA